MLGRLAAVAALVTLMGCAGLEPAGRNASRSPQPSPPPAASAPAPATAPAYTPPPAVTSAPLPAATPAPAPAASAPTPAPVARAPAPVVTPPPPAPAAAPSPSTAPVISSEAPPQAVDTRARQGDIVVPTERERQVQAPDGDPRSTSERMQDINSWDRCVTHVQSAYERDPMRPQLQSPEEYCSQSLGMANRNAIPLSRQERRR